jgi:glutamate racemase
MIEPICVFDSGLGSFDIVKRLREFAPKLNLIYLADRANFPYGTKSPSQLFDLICGAIDYLRSSYSTTKIVLASNVPSIIFLPSIQRHFEGVSFWGVVPPIKEALAISTTKRICVLGVATMIRDSSFERYLFENTSEGEIAYAANASPLVDLVESGEFLYNPNGTKATIKLIVDEFIATHPSVDTFTLSSTHLPWLKKYFSDIYPELNFVDPAGRIINDICGQLTDVPAGSNGTTIGLVTDSKQYRFFDAVCILRKLGADFPLININNIQTNSYGYNKKNGQTL